MSNSLIALYVLLGAAAAAVVFTLVFVVLADRSLARSRSEGEGPRAGDGARRPGGEDPEAGGR
jgi:hypothetical protein